MLIKRESVARLVESMIYEDEEALAVHGYEEFAESLEGYWRTVASAHRRCAEEAIKRAGQAYMLEAQEADEELDLSRLSPEERNKFRRERLRELLAQYAIPKETDALEDNNGN